MHIQVAEPTLPKRQRRVDPPSNGEHDTDVAPGGGKGEDAGQPGPNLSLQTPRQRHTPNVVLNGSASRVMSQQEPSHPHESNPTTPKHSHQSPRTQRQPQADANKIHSAQYPEHESHISASTQPGEQLQLSDDDPASPTTVQESAKIIEDHIEQAVKMFNDDACEYARKIQQLNETAKTVRGRIRTLTEAAEGKDVDGVLRVQMAEQQVASAVRERDLLREKLAQDRRIEQLTRQADDLANENAKLSSDNAFLVAEIRRLGAFPQ